MTVPEDGLVVGPGDGQVLLPGRGWLPLRAADTSSGIAMLEVVLPPGARPERPHVHHRTDAAPFPGGSTGITWSQVTVFATPNDPATRRTGPSVPRPR